MYSLASRRAFGRMLWAAACLGVLLLSAASVTSEDKNGGSTSAAVDPVYEPGGDVTPPKLTHYVEPDFTPTSKEAFVEGVVRISTVVKADGTPDQLRVLKGLNEKEDEQATRAVHQWRFQPGTRQGRPVNVRVTVEVEFHLL